MSDGYRDGIHTRTDFRENGFGIDPQGCGCTDCLVGYSFNEGDSRIDTAIAQGRTLYNRTYGEYILPNGYRIEHGGVWRALPTAQHCVTCTCNRAW